MYAYPNGPPSMICDLRMLINPFKKIPVNIFIFFLFSTIISKCFYYILSFLPVYLLTNRFTSVPYYRVLYYHLIFVLLKDTLGDVLLAIFHMLSYIFLCAVLFAQFLFSFTAYVFQFCSIIVEFMCYYALLLLLDSTSL